jgi:hypothetical protein
MMIDTNQKDQLYDRLIEAVDLSEETDTWRKLWFAAWDQLFTTMSQEHKEIVILGVNKLAEDLKTRRKGTYDNLSNRAVLMVFFHCFDKIHNPDRKHPLALPPSIAQIYMDDKDSWANALCNSCGYWYPHPHFKNCPLCGD